MTLDTLFPGFDPSRRQAGAINRPLIARVSSNADDDRG